MQTGSHRASLGLEMATPDRDHILRVAAGETTMIAYFMIAELTVLILLCFIGPTQQEFHNRN